jgi:GrpB-like predicted nucleotidyltransferase (UPF0157 family)
VSDAVPAWAYEKTEILPHDPRLARRARAERDRLAGLLAPWLVDGVEHVGSTAVPGLAAKPVIDLMASVTDPDLVVVRARERLAADGWCYVPPDVDRGGLWRRFFVKPDASGQRRVAHLHVIRTGHPRWAEQIAFRDALRSDDRMARSYEGLKQRLAAQHAGDREAYTDAKTEFIATALRQAAGPAPSDGPAARDLSAHAPDSAPLSARFASVG